jgi:hypothetical protein
MGKVPILVCLKDFAPQLQGAAQCHPRAYRDVSGLGGCNLTADLNTACYLRMVGVTQSVVVRINPGTEHTLLGSFTGGC